MNSAEEYIESHTGETRKRLEKLDKIIRSTNKNIISKISWSMPSYVLDGNYILQFCAHKKHIGLYALPYAIDAFRGEIEEAGLICTKGGVQLPNDKPLPEELIKKMAVFNINAKTKMNAELVVSTKPKAEAVTRLEKELPIEIKSRLIEEVQLENYKARPRYQRTDYISWIERAVREETKEKRTSQMIEELRNGDAYMGMIYNAKRGEKC